MDPERIWKTGDKVRVKHEGREVDGEVMLSSGNGRALVLSFEAILGGHVGTMPVLWLESLGAEGGFASQLVSAKKVTVPSVAFYHRDGPLPLARACEATGNANSSPRFG